MFFGARVGVCVDSSSAFVPVTGFGGSVALLSLADHRARSSHCFLLYARASPLSRPFSSPSAVGGVGVPSSTGRRLYSRGSRPVTRCLIISLHHSLVELRLYRKRGAPKYRRHAIQRLHRPLLGTQHAHVATTNSAAVPAIRIRGFVQGVRTPAMLPLCCVPAHLAHVLPGPRPRCPTPAPSTLDPSPRPCPSHSASLLCPPCVSVSARPSRHPSPLRPLPAGNPPCAFRPSVATPISPAFPCMSSAHPFPSLPATAPPPRTSASPYPSRCVLSMCLSVLAPSSRSLSRPACPIPPPHRRLPPPRYTGTVLSARARAPAPVPSRLRVAASAVSPDTPPRRRPQPPASPPPTTTLALARARASHLHLHVPIPSPVPFHPHPSPAPIPPPSALPFLSSHPHARLPSRPHRSPISSHAPPTAASTRTRRNAPAATPSSKRRRSRGACPPAVRIATRRRARCVLRQGESVGGVYDCAERQCSESGACARQQRRKHQPALRGQHDAADDEHPSAARGWDEVAFVWFLVLRP
ncbi:hypothetical protein B0H14DRAFT_3600599 [Mycena olivaceomarginata]|nr:hypothetical protein B0H14DRAFT_3600599 [Mycena olivaceomarginata]